jgi:tetratricopeptide (TPR) repeat protein
MPQWFHNPARETRRGPSDAYEESANQLHDELVLRAKANRLDFLGRFAEAFAVLPEDIRYRKMRDLYEQGQPYLQALLYFYRNNPQALTFLTESLFAAPSDAARMKSVFERILQLDPDNVSALNMLGAMHSEAGDQQTAESYLRRALRRDPRSVKSLHNLGELLERTGRHVEARQYWQEAAVVSNNAMEADHWGARLLQEGRVAEALQWFRHAVEIQPTLISARLHLALLLFKTGRTPEALPHVRYVLKLDPDNKAALGILAEREAQRAASSNP